MDVKATQKYLITSPKKFREVVARIRSLSPLKAYQLLPFVGKRAGMRLRKVIGSALAQARLKNMNENDLYFKEIQVNEGPRLKRWRAGARGMAKPYKRRMSHIRIVLGVKESPDVSKDSETGIDLNEKKTSNKDSKIIKNVSKKPKVINQLRSELKKDGKK